MYNNLIIIIPSLIVSCCSLIYLIAYIKNRGKGAAGGASMPGVSLIVPMWNEEKTIGATLDSLIDMKNAYGGEMEIIVIDDRSSDRSLEVVREYNRKYPFVRPYMKEGKQGKSESLNQGIEISRYQLVGCVDADSYPRADALGHAVGVFRDPRVGAVTTMLVVNRPRGVVEWFQQVEYIFSNFILTALDALNAVFVARGPLSLFRKDVMEKIGGFMSSDITPTEDMEITFRIRKAGYTIRVAGQSKVYTTVMPTWRNLFWQRMRWNRGTLVNFWLHRDMFLDTRYGMFGMFVLPVSLLMIATAVMLFFQRFFDISIFFIDNHPWIYWLMTKGMDTGALGLKGSALSGGFFGITLTTLLTLVLLGQYLIINGLGLRESRERLNTGYMLAMIGTPVIYVPVLVFFWISAITLQACRFGMRWR